MIVFIRENVSFFFFPKLSLLLHFAISFLPHPSFLPLVAFIRRARSPPFSAVFPRFPLVSFSQFHRSSSPVGLCFLSLFPVSCLSFFITLYHSLLVSRVRTYYISSLSSPFLITLFLVLHLFTSLRMIIEQFAKSNHDVKMGRNRGRTGRIKTRELRFSRG